MLGKGGRKNAGVGPCKMSPAVYTGRHAGVGVIMLFTELLTSQKCFSVEKMRTLLT